MPHLFWYWMWPQRPIQSGPSPPISPSCHPATRPSAPNPRDAPRCPHAARHSCPPGCWRSRVWRRSRLCRTQTCCLWDPLERRSTQTPARSILTRRDCLRGSTGGPSRVQPAVPHRRASPPTAPPPSRAEGLGPTAPPSSRRSRLVTHTADRKWCLSRLAPGPSVDYYIFKAIPALRSCIKLLKTVAFLHLIAMGVAALTHIFIIFLLWGDHKFDAVEKGQLLRLICAAFKATYPLFPGSLT